MESETPASAQIFFKDKNNELKGPFTERQVQAWYTEDKEKKWFTSSISFCFMKEDERPCNDTEFFTLESLIAHNGIGCPFKAIARSMEERREDEREGKENRVDNMEKELAELRLRCEELQKRLEKVEREVLPPLEDDSPPWASSEQSGDAASAAEKSVDAASAADYVTANDDGQASGSSAYEEKKKKNKGKKEGEEEEERHDKKEKEEHKDEDKKDKYVPKPVNAEVQERDKEREEELKKFNEKEKEITSKEREMEVEKKRKKKRERTPLTVFDSFVSLSSDRYIDMDQEKKMKKLIKKFNKLDSKVIEVHELLAERYNIEDEEVEEVEATDPVDFYNLAIKSFEFDVNDSLGMICALQGLDDISSFPGVLDMELFVKRLRRSEHEYYFCSFCDHMTFNARQMFMHFGSPEHLAKVTEKSYDHLQLTNALITMIGKERVDLMLKQEAEQVEKQQKQWESIALDDPALRPTLGAHPAFGRWCSCLPHMDRLRMGWAKSGYKLAYQATGIIARKGFGNEQMTKINQDIGGAKTRCLACKLIFADAKEYYEHLLTNYHLSKENTFDFVTIVVNMMKRHLAKKQPWPEMTDE